MERVLLSFLRLHETPIEKESMQPNDTKTVEIIRDIRADGFIPNH